MYFDIPKNWPYREPKSFHMPLVYTLVQMIFVVVSFFLSSSDLQARMTVFSATSSASSWRSFCVYFDEFESEGECFVKSEIRSFIEEIPAGEYDDGNYSDQDE